MLGNAEYSRTYGAPAAQLRGEFFMDTVKNVRASLEAGREIFGEVERVRIIIPGAIASIVVKNVTDEHRERWPEAYRAFRAGQEPALAGTPLEEWPVLNKAMVAELKHLQIRTVEELAGLSDIAVQHIGMGGQVLRERARVWLDDAQHEALTNRYLHENDQLRGEIAALKNQVEQLSRHLLLLSDASRQRRDAPPALQTYIPGEEDPVEQAKTAPGAIGARLPGIPGAQPAPSALDALAASGARPRRERRPVSEPPPVMIAAIAAAEAAGAESEAEHADG